MSRAGILSRLSGVERLEDRLDHQDQTAKEHREYEREALTELKTLALKTNGRVDKHETRLGVIEARATRALSWKQGGVIALLGGGGYYILHAAGVV